MAHRNRFDVALDNIGKDFATLKAKKAQAPKAGTSKSKRELTQIDPVQQRLAQMGINTSDIQ